MRNATKVLLVSLISISACKTSSNRSSDGSLKASIVSCTDTKTPELARCLEASGSNMESLVLMCTFAGVKTANVPCDQVAFPRHCPQLLTEEVNGAKREVKLDGWYGPQSTLACASTVANSGVSPPADGSSETGLSEPNPEILRIERYCYAELNKNLADSFYRNSAKVGSKYLRASPTSIWAPDAAGVYNRLSHTVVDLQFSNCGNDSQSYKAGTSLSVEKFDIYASEALTGVPLCTYEASTQFDGTYSFNLVNRSSVLVSEVSGMKEKCGVTQGYTKKAPQILSVYVKK